MTSGVERKLTTILAADAEGYSRAMEADEIAALGALRDARAVFAKFIDRHNGRIVNTAGDGLIAEFPSVVEAVQCAIEVQGELGDPGKPPGGALRFRIGIHLGDVMVDGDDLLGEGVNLAARLESMADPGGILISRQVYDQVHAKLSVGFEYLGEKRPKNYAEDVAVYGIALGKQPRGGGAPGDRPPRGPQPTEPPPADVRDRVVRHAKQLGVVLAGLVVIDLATGPAFWVQWPAIGMAAFVAMEATPLYAPGWVSRQLARAAVIIAALVLINLLTWQGYPWALWPAGALLAAVFLRRAGTRSRG